MKNILIITLLMFSVVFVNAQEAKKKTKKQKRAEREAIKIAETKTMIENKAFIFIPTQALPTGMKSVMLTSSFDAKIENDTIDCYLPFYGRAFTAEYGGNDSPMFFNQRLLKYSTEELKKGGWMIKFDVKNKNNLINFTFQIGETGSTSLSVTSANRAPISYFGELVKIEEKTKKIKKKRN